MFNKMVMLAASLASRGLKGIKTDIKTKQLRVLSCFGDENISACPYLKNSKKEGQFYCDKCGCGDRKHTWLIKESGEYSKLDYPTLNCPIKMPGFSNYDPNYYDKAVAERKKTIEEYDPEKLQYIKVTIGSNPIKEQILNDVNKII